MLFYGIFAVAVAPNQVFHFFLFYLLSLFVFWSCDSCGCGRREVGLVVPSKVAREGELHHLLTTPIATSYSSPSRPFSPPFDVVTSIFSILLRFQFPSISSLSARTTSCYPARNPLLFPYPQLISSFSCRNCPSSHIRPHNPYPSPVLKRNPPTVFMLANYWKKRHLLISNWNWSPTQKCAHLLRLPHPQLMYSLASGIFSLRISVCIAYSCSEMIFHFHYFLFNINPVFRTGKGTKHSTRSYYFVQQSVPLMILVFSQSQPPLFFV